MRHEREQLAAEARLLMGDEALISFLRSCRGTTSVLACRLINEELEQGCTLDALFYTGSPLGYRLTARQTGPNELRVSFGCQANPDVGDGGEWIVVLTPSGGIDRIELEAQWMS